ncbi:hypothetical protein GCM10007159_41050 [Modicisalibacter luteus]|nr:hypothetical protein GCM10007159_41050 [Halomonas lutea]
MTKKTRRRFSDEFKADAVSLVMDQRYSLSVAARRLGGSAAYWIVGAASTVSRHPMPRAGKKMIAMPRSRSPVKKFVNFRLKRIS